MTEPAQPVIHLDQLTVRYGHDTALDGVSLDVEPGAVYALLGRNGAGKSSAVRTLLGQQRPGGGAASLFGCDAWTHRSTLMKRVGVVPEDPDAPPAMTPVALGAWCSRVYSTWDRATYDARLARFGIPSQPFGRLSKGQRGHVMLALALGHSPDLLVLDDPTLGLDVIARDDLFLELISDLADRGTTVFLTTHDLAGIEKIASRIGILRDGKLMVDEDLDPLKQRFRERGATSLEEIFGLVVGREGVS